MDDAEKTLNPGGRDLLRKKELWLKSNVILRKRVTVILRQKKWIEWKNQSFRCYFTPTVKHLTLLMVTCWLHMHKWTVNYLMIRSAAGSEHKRSNFFFLKLQVISHRSANITNVTNCSAQALKKKGSHGCCSCSFHIKKKAACNKFTLRERCKTKRSREEEKRLFFRGKNCSATDILQSSNNGKLHVRLK